MSDLDGESGWLSPKYWFVLTILLVVPLGTSLTLYGAREARMIRAANILAQEIQSPNDESAADWRAEDWVEYLTASVPMNYQADALEKPGGRPSPFEGISIGSFPPEKSWQVTVWAEDDERTIFIDVFGPNSSQPIYSREIQYPKLPASQTESSLAAN